MIQLKLICDLECNGHIKWDRLACASIMNICAALRNLANGKKGKHSKRTLLEFSEDKFIESQKSVPTKLPSGTRSTYAISFSSCGNFVATSTGDHFVHILKTNTGEHVKTLAGHPRTCWSVVFHPNNSNLIASGDLSGEVRIWGLDGGSEIWRRTGTLHNGK